MNRIASYLSVSHTAATGVTVAIRQRHNWPCRMITLSGPDGQHENAWHMAEALILQSQTPEAAEERRVRNATLGTPALLAGAPSQIAPQTPPPTASRTSKRKSTAGAPPLADAAALGALALPPTDPAMQFGMAGFIPGMLGSGSASSGSSWSSGLTMPFQPLLNPLLQSQNPLLQQHSLLLQQHQPHPLQSPLQMLQQQQLFQQQQLLQQQQLQSMQVAAATMQLQARPSETPALANAASEESSSEAEVVPPHPKKTLLPTGKAKAQRSAFIPPAAAEAAGDAAASSGDETDDQVITQAEVDRVVRAKSKLQRNKMVPKRPPVDPPPQLVPQTRPYTRVQVPKRGSIQDCKS